MDAEARLAEERGRVERRIAELERQHTAIVAASESANLDDEHDPEGATVGFERAQVDALRQRAREHLVEVDDALRRVDAGTYGTCTRCGAPIAPERLDARPTTDRCVDCAAG
jgi:RNA polymerase-binding protein DksA